ncbi:putative response regulator and transcription factor RR-A-type family [Helianthus annuus]|nr:putative response regulator and transcription factor RR-A-type family [Helianthus annuus]KAJ0897164.1 putative response regulator and transcription factor RR-A-type family [Helianthus annuus]
MRRVGVSTNVPAPKGLAELNHHNRVDLKEGRNGFRFDGQGMSEEDESRINEDVNIIRPNELGQAHAMLHRQRQQPQGPVVQWESFLPLRYLKVLLVENDDSTRHVVNALLRNCGYEVTAVANGLEAWKLLIDLNKQIDLVLTEVVMPYLSGIGLLSKIMNHATRKNIPVIMMSSDDSMGIVFNCLSKGAVDFLVKPIRKNELKNLWQHVWRKCHSSSGSGSGSGSESGIRDHKSTKSRSNQESDDNSDNSDEDDKLNAKGGSDNGSGTQSSWPKKVVEVDSSQANSLWDTVPNPHDVTSAQVARPETSKLEIIEMGKDLEIGVPKSTSFEVEDTNKKMDKFCESNMEKVGDKIDISMQLGCETGASRTEPLNAHKDALKANQLLKNINIEDNYSKESHALELSLKRPRDVEDADASTQERNVLRHSGLSAFSRYNTVSNVNQTPTGNVDSCSPPPADISSEEAKRNNILSNSNGTPNQRSNGSDDLGSTTNNAFTTKPDDNPLPVVVHKHAMQALVPCANNKDAVVKSTVPQRKAPVQVRHHHHHYHHHHHHVHNKTGDGFSRNMGSNFLTGSTEGNALNYGSGSGSNNKSNGENGAIVEGGMIEKGVGNGGPTVFNGGGDGSGGSGSGVDQERLTQRKVALNKFLQKRKVRCFKKKVRYQSRKKLAEQRPRVRGQFVKRGVNNEDADS